MTSDAHGIMGRYTPDGEPAEALVEVRLLNFPLRLFEQTREHHDEVMREFALLALRPPQPGSGKDVPKRLLELIELLGVRYGAAGERTDVVRDAALARGEPTADLSYALPRSAVDPLRLLHRLMDDADAFCRSEQLLTLAETPSQRRFRNWFIQQFVSQLAGRPPQPWDGPLADPEPG